MVAEKIFLTWREKLILTLFFLPGVLSLHHDLMLKLIIPALILKWKHSENLEMGICFNFDRKNIWDRCSLTCSNAIIWKEGHRYSSLRSWDFAGLQKSCPFRCMSHGIGFEVDNCRGFTVSLHSIMGVQSLKTDMVAMFIKVTWWWWHWGIETTMTLFFFLFFS